MDTRHKTNATRVAQHGLKTALFVGTVVALGGCAAGAGGISMGMLGTALAVIVSLSGCTRSHADGSDHDEDGFDNRTDCNDFDDTIFPSATEIACDGIDQDCDGADFCDDPCVDLPPGVPCNPFMDADGDGFGPDDCNDGDASIYPGAPEDACPDGIDQNCDGVDGDIDIICNPAPDVDGDGYSADVDCDDEDPLINPGIEEPVCPDGIDQDCDGIDGEADIICNDFDTDGDGHPESRDCDDTNARIHPDAEEYCDDGVDQNCDGNDSEDGCLFINGMLDVDGFDELEPMQSIAPDDSALV